MIIFSKYQQLIFKLVIYYSLHIINMKSTVFATLLGVGLTNSLNNKQSVNLDIGSSARGHSQSNNFSYSSRTGTQQNSRSLLNNLASASHNMGNQISSSFNSNLENLRGSSSATGFNSFGLNLNSNGLGSNSNDLFGIGNGLSMGDTQGIDVTSFGAVNTGFQGLSSGTGLSNIGTAGVLVSPALSGSQFRSGGFIVNRNYPKADLDLVSSVSSSVVNNNLLASGIINNAKLISSQFGGTKSLGSLFNRLPSFGQIDNMILSVDSGALISTIQAIGTNEQLPCDQRISYLLQILGRLRAALAKKIFAADQVKIITDAASNQINRLQSLIDNNNAAIKKLGIDQIRKDLQTLLNNLQDAYINYNNIQTQIPTMQAQLKGYDQQIIILNKNSDTIRNSIANDRIKLTSISAEIASIRARYKELQDRQIGLETSIAKGEATIVDNQKAVKDINYKIEALQARLKQLAKSIDKYSAQSKDLQIKVSRIRTDISINQAKRNKLINENNSINDRITQQKKKNIPENISIITDMIDTLKQLVPKVQSQIDRHYYYCFGEGKVQIQKNGGVLMYIVRGQAFQNYLKNLYGKSFAIANPDSDISFNRVDIFGQNWVGAFGYPFAKNAFGSSDFSLNGSFNCMNPNALVTGSGTITAIDSDSIECMDDQSKSKRRFRLGSCSRLQSTKKIPNIGQKFFYSGVPDATGFNLYAGSCFE